MSEPRLPEEPGDNASAEDRREYGRQLAMDGLLRAAMQSSNDNTEDSDASESKPEAKPLTGRSTAFLRAAKSPTPRASRRRRSSRRRTNSISPWPLALAACAALAVGLFVWKQQQTPRVEALATLHTLSGTPQLTRAGQTRNAQSQDTLLPNDTLQTSEGQSLTLRYADGTELTLEAASRATLTLENEAKQVRLESGALRAHIAKQPSGKPMLFQTVHAQATVLGTTLSLQLQSDGTRLSVEEGRVRLSNSASTNSVEVAGGESAVASALGAVALLEKKPAPYVIPPFGPSAGRPYAASSPWNTPIPSTPVLDVSSAQIVENLRQRASVSLFKFAIPVYHANPDTPVRKVTTTLPWGKSPFSGFDVRVPDHAKPNSGGNAAFVVVDWQSRRTWEFYKFQWEEKPAGREIKTAWGGTLSIDGSGHDDMLGSGTAGASMLSGLVRVHEIEAGRIDHAITIASKFATKEIRIPGRKSDGDYTGPGGIPVGARVQLDPGIDVAAIPGISRAELAIARALQTYGAYCIGKTPQPLLINFELAPDATSQQQPGKVYSENGLKGEDLTRIPWDKLRVLKNWNGQ